MNYAQRMERMKQFRSAACVVTGTEMVHESPVPAAAVVGVCASCPVIAECRADFRERLADVDGHRLFGVWAGVWVPPHGKWGNSRDDALTLLGVS